MKNNSKIVRVTAIFMVSCVLLALFSSCGQPSAFKKEGTDEPTVASSTTTLNEETENPTEKYNELVDYINDNGERYTYNYVPKYGGSVLISFSSQVVYSKVVWEDYIETTNKSVDIAIKIGIAYSSTSGVSILGEFKYPNLDRPFYVRITTGSNGEGTAEVVDYRAVDTSGIVLTFDAANFDGEMDIINRDGFTNAYTIDYFEESALEAANCIIGYAEEFIETVIPGANLKTIGIGSSHTLSGGDTTYAEGETAKVIADYNLLEGDDVISSDKVEIKCSVKDQTKTYTARVAVINSPNTVFGSVMYLDILDENGALLFSKRYPEIGFIAFTDSQIIIYNLLFREDNRILATSAVCYFTDDTASGIDLNEPRLMEDPSLSETLTFSASTRSEAAAFNQPFSSFSFSTADNFGSVKGARIMIYSNGETAGVLHHTNQLIDDDVLNKIASFTTSDVFEMLN